MQSRHFHPPYFLANPAASIGQIESIDHSIKPIDCFPRRALFDDHSMCIGLLVAQHTIR